MLCHGNQTSSPLQVAPGQVRVCCPGSHPRHPSSREQSHSPNRGAVPHALQCGQKSADSAPRGFGDSDQVIQWNHCLLEHCNGNVWMVTSMSSCGKQKHTVMNSILVACLNILSFQAKHLQHCDILSICMTCLSIVSLWFMEQHVAQADLVVKL